MKLTTHGGWPLALMALGLLAACSDNDHRRSDAQYQAEIRRTTMGVPHIKADDWAGLGYGYGYAQAEDNLCTMADSFLTYRGERSQHFGAEASLKTSGTIGQQNNLDSDFFHRHVITDARITAMVEQQPDELRELVDGFAAGYNRYLRELARNGDAHAECRDEPWVTPVTDTDIYRRLYQANLAGGYSNFVPNIASALPPDIAGLTSGDQPRARSLRAVDPASLDLVAPKLQVGGEDGVGSNMFGFGTEATGTDSPLLFGNPHWYWRGPDRFYQAQLTIPGTVDVSGASFLGVPVILIGHNENVAWSHTVSTARRFGFFQLTLDPTDPTRYLRDGESVAMTASTITVETLQEDGSLVPVTRTLYTSEFGPMVNLALLNPALAWNTTTAFAIRDINADNYRTFRTWMRWNRAASLEEFQTIQREEVSIPWVNTVAVGRGSAQAWYADIGAVPNVSDQQLQDCTTPFGLAVGAVLPRVPFLDGSRSACDWQSDEDSVQDGAIGPARLPSQLRDDYVANMNDSHWLTNPAAPLVGYPAIMGAERAPVTLRTRLGHLLAQGRLAGTDAHGAAGASVEAVQAMVLNNRVLSAELFKDEALAIVCVDPEGDAARACDALAAWDNTGETDARGAHVWDVFWGRAGAVPNLYSVPFDADDPVNTPRGINPLAATGLHAAFEETVIAVGDSGYAFDAARGEYLFATRGERIPLFGGCGAVGYFTISCPEVGITSSRYLGMDGNPNGNSYMQVVTFPASGVEAHTFLTFSLSDDPASPHYGDYTRRYADKQWLRMPFTDAQITANPDYRSVRLKE